LPRTCGLKYVIERKKEREKIEVTGRRGRRRKKLLDDLKEERERCWKLQEEALDHTMCRTREAMDLS